LQASTTAQAPGEDVLDFALVADPLAEVGLHVTLYSLLHHLDRSKRARIHLLLRYYGREPLTRLDATLAGYRDRFELRIHDLAGFELGRGRGVHYSRTPYAKLHVPLVVEADRVLYLDADLLILTDMSAAFDVDLAAHAAASIRPRHVGNALPKDRALLNSLSISDDRPYYKTGAVLFNVRRWRERDLSALCFTFVDQYGGRLATADQTVFNAVLQDELTGLPERFNRSCYPSSPRYEIAPRDCVLHFAGAPKPWDLAGELLHRNYPLFKVWLERTAFADYRSYHGLSWGRLRRTLVLGRAYAKVLGAA
jgi:lipopolysaccharide biosynthesis glycosyltransferase